MKSLLFGLALMLTPMAAFAAETMKPTPDLVGDWMGELQGPDGPVPIVFHIGDKTTGDSPSQEAFAIPATLSKAGDQWVLDFDSIQAVFKVKVGADGVMTGAMDQNGMTLLVTMKRAKPAAKPAP
jgi:hypothetical protein